MVPERWQDVIELLWAPIAWIPRLQEVLLAFFVSPASRWALVARYVMLVIPALLGLVAIWTTVLAVYTLPFRSRRVRFVSMLLLAWWDAARAVWLYWAGVVRLASLAIGWIFSLAALAVRLTVEAVHRLATTPVALTARAARRYVGSGAPWIALLALLGWCVMEAAVFTYTMLPAVSNTLTELAGGVEPSRFTAGVLYALLLLLILGSFACMQTLVDAVRRRELTFLAQMILVELLVMVFEVAFLYRQLVGALAPWAGTPLPPALTLAVAALGWLATRSLTWFLFAQQGTAPLLALIARRPRVDADPWEPADRFAARSAAWWQSAADDFRREVEWLHAKGDEILECLALPVLQLVAAALNFGMLVVASRPVFSLPFRSMGEIADTRELLAELHFAPRKQPIV
jgi:hypothetical protein